MVTSFFVISSFYAFACHYDRRSGGVSKKIVPLIMSKKNGNIVIHNTNPYIANSRINILREHSCLKDLSSIPKEKYAIIEDCPNNVWVKNVSYVQDSKNMTIAKYNKQNKDSSENSPIIVLTAFYIIYVTYVFIYVFNAYL